MMSDLSKNDIGIKEVGIRYIKEEKTGYLLSSLPYTVVKEMYDDSRLPKDALDTITISTQAALYGSAFLSRADTSVTFYTSDLYGQDISLEYESDGDLKLDIPSGDDIDLPGGGDIPGGNIPGGGSTPGGSIPGGGGSSPGNKDNYYNFWKKKEKN